MPVTVNVDGLTSRFSKRNIDKARYEAANQAMTNMNKYVPYSGENGNQVHLRDTSHATSDGSQITWTTKYATAQFYGVVNGHRVQHYTVTSGEPGKSKRWDLRMTGNKQDMREVSDAFKNTLLKG